MESHPGSVQRCATLGVGVRSTLGPRALEADSKMLTVGKVGWTLFLIQCAAVALLFGGYWGLKTNMVALEHQNRILEQRLAVAERRLDASVVPPAKPPGTLAPLAAVTASALATTEPSGSASATQPPAKSVAEAVADTVVCVDKNTHTIVPCERAASCLGLKSFDVTYFNGLRTKLGISSPMM